MLLQKQLRRVALDVQHDCGRLVANPAVAGSSPAYDSPTYRPMPARRGRSGRRWGVLHFVAASVMVMLVLFWVLFWLQTGATSIAHPPLDFGKPAAAEALLPKLSPTACKQADRLRVCSHRAAAAELGLEDGSLQALRALWNYGIRCFDMDFVMTSDRLLLATHPDRLQAAMPNNNPIGIVKHNLHKHSLAQIRSLGAREKSFPTVHQLIEEFATLIQQDSHSNQAHYAGDLRKAPLLFMDLKGGAFNSESIAGIARFARHLGIASHLALFVLSEQHQDELAKGHAWDGPLIRGFMDLQNLANGTVVPAKPLVNAQVMSPFALLGPSIKLSREFYMQAYALGKPVFPWVVDTPKTLQWALEMQVDGAISNEPMQLGQMLERWRRRCKQDRRTGPG
ncbi:hypothetical protein WJX72_010116 [[Myrmecia] bisecta]|uniref:glycerophosphodiester phosphodiesterase n=1 Tax=[Myrmecia] bisecta TaxID=41462 RepID=A0AAW1PKK6_9CHLO